MSGCARAKRHLLALPGRWLKGSGKLLLCLKLLLLKLDLDKLLLNVGERVLKLRALSLKAAGGLGAAFLFPPAGKL
jgi:hypothetical protein